MIANVGIGLEEPIERAVATVAGEFLVLGFDKIFAVHVRVLDKIKLGGNGWHRVPHVSVLCDKNMIQSK